MFRNLKKRLHIVKVGTQSGDANGLFATAA
jgi:hypothetical protein